MNYYKYNNHIMNVRNNSHSNMNGFLFRFIYTYITYISYYVK